MLACLQLDPHDDFNSNKASAGDGFQRKAVSNHPLCPCSDLNPCGTCADLRQALVSDEASGMDALLDRDLRPADSYVSKSGMCAVFA